MVKTAALSGVIWAVAFVLLESIQFVYFGAVFQRVSSVLFGSIVLGLTVILFVGWSAWRHGDELRIALGLPRLLLAINLTATLSWLGFLTSVQLIEPAVAYTIGSGAMPVTAFILYRLGITGGEALRNRTEAAGILIIAVSVTLLGIFTVAGLSGFTRGGVAMAWIGVLLAAGEGALFTWLLVLCARLDRRGVGPNVVFGLRFPLYVLVAGAMAAMGVDQKEVLALSEWGVIVILGLALIVPPLYALQRAVAQISTLTISAITALGPFTIFVLQMIEGRVSFAGATLLGLGLYFAGSLIAATGAVRGTLSPRP